MVVSGWQGVVGVCRFCSEGGSAMGINTVWSHSVEMRWDVHVQCNAGQGRQDAE